MHMNGLKEILLDAGCDEKTIEVMKGLQGKELLKELKKRRCLQLEKLHEEQRKIDRLDYLIRKEEGKI